MHLWVKPHAAMDPDVTRRHNISMKSTYVGENVSLCIRFCHALLR